MKTKRGRLIGVSLLSLILLLIIGVLLFLIFSGDSVETLEIEEEPIEEYEEYEEPIEEEPEEEEPPIEEPEIPKKEYPQPEYAFEEESVIIKIPGMKEEFTYAWVSDVHLITDIEEGDVDEEFLATLQQRYETLPVTDDGVHAKDLWPEIVKYLNYNYGEGNIDAVLFGGDLLDYYSPKNMEYFETYFKQLDVPYVYIRADHDYGAFYGASESEAYQRHDQLDDDSWEEKYIEEEDFIILGINGSTKDIPEERLPYLEEMFAKEKPIIIMTHVPYEAKVETPDIEESLEELSMRVRNKIYYWGGGSYKPNDKTKQYFNMLYADDTPVVQVLAGHMHEKWEGLITEQVQQHIFTPAFKGTIGIVHIVPDGYSEKEELKDNIFNSISSNNP